MTHLDAIGLVQKLAFSLKETELEVAEVVVVPPFTALRSVQTLVTGDKLEVGYGAQDLSAADSGAYTGEISGAMLAALACEYVVVGHSERRAMHAEDDAVVAAKAAAALRHGIVPIVCVGEGLDVRKAGDHVAYCTTQLDASLDGLTAEQLRGATPVRRWSSRTSRSGRSARARWRRRRMRRRSAGRCARGSPSGSEPETAEIVRILYGGSVKAANTAGILAGPDVDGALVGGASLDADEFAQICRIAAGGS